MKLSNLQQFIMLALLAVVASPRQVAAQGTRYKLIDIPTLGGPGTIGQVDGPGISQYINNPGAVVGGADTSIHDPTAPGCADCFLVHAFRWQDGITTDLGALPGVNFSHATSINARGWATGGSFTSEFDPLKGQPAEHAVLWKGDEITDLGTLGTGRESAALYVNNAGEAVGFSTYDTTPDPNSFLGAAIHAFIWKGGVMQDLNTLGGPDSFPAGGCSNQQAGLVAGQSSTNSARNPTTGFPTEHAFLWKNGIMKNIPSLGGTFALAQCANSAGQVIGQSSLQGDPGCVFGDPFDTCEEHAFSWGGGVLTDLKPFLGGSFSTAIWLNNSGEAVGGATTANDASFHAALWQDGHIVDLGTLEGDCFSIANAINSKGQIIGQSFPCDFSSSRAVLWDHGAIIDLNTTIPPNPTLQLAETDNINDRGEIVGRGLPAGCDFANDGLDACGHVFLLVPCAAGHGCQGSADIGAQISSPTITKNDLSPIQRRQLTKAFVTHLRARMAQRYQTRLGAPR